MKIAHLFQGPGFRISQSGAAQLHIYHTMRGLQQAGHHVSLLGLLSNRRVFYTSDLGVFKNERAPDVSTGKLGWSDSRAFKLFESGIRRTQKELNLPYLGIFDSCRMYDACRQNLLGYDIIHERYNLLALGGALASRNLGVPLVLEINADLIAQRKFKGRPERGLRRAFAIWSTRFCFYCASKIICISAELKEHLIRRWHIHANKLAVLPCAADAEAFGKRYDNAYVREKLNLNNELVVMWVGGFYPWHDLDLLLESFRRVLQELPDTKLILVGDGETREIVARKVKRNGLARSVLMTGAVAHQRVPEMLSIADVAVLPSAPVSAGQGGTGTPLKLFEYMAAGKPIVATAVSHATTVIKDGINGLLVEVGDVDGFAGSVLRVLGDSVLRDQLSKNARRHAVERYTWEEYTTRLEDIYRNLL